MNADNMRTGQNKSFADRQFDWHFGFIAQGSETCKPALPCKLSVFCPRTIFGKLQITTEANAAYTWIYWKFCMWFAVSDTSKYPHNPKVAGSNPVPATSNNTKTYIIISA